MERELDKIWQQCPLDIQESYGEEYLQDFKNSLSNHLNRARPNELISEVIDDMVDAVAGVSPKVDWLFMYFYYFLLGVLPPNFI